MTNQDGLVISGARILTPGGSAVGELRVDRGRITAIGDAVEHTEALVLDGSGGYLSPGFIDIQASGVAGHGIADPPAAISTVAAQLPRHGVTTFLPTLISPDASTVQDALAMLSRHRPGPGMAVPLGLHLDGPRTSPTAAGKPPASRAGHLPDGGADLWNPRQGVRLVTVTSDTANADLTIEALSGRGVVVSVDLTRDDHDRAKGAFAAGATLVAVRIDRTTASTHRRLGLLDDVLADERIWTSSVVNGRPVHPAAADAAARTVAPRRFIALSDRSGLDQAMRNLVSVEGFSPDEAIRSVTINPALALRLNHQGRLEVGTKADLVLLDDALRVRATWIAGRLAFDDGLGAC